MTPELRKTIRSVYAAELPSIMEARGRGRKTDPYYLDWVTMFTPIEWLLWQDIRFYGVPLYPQFPVGNRFVDFGDPFLKIAVEADGAAYHDQQSDIARDIELAENGWTVFHVTGKQTHIVEYPLTEMSENDPQYCNVAVDWGCRTSTGFIWAMDKYFYRKRVSDSVRSAAFVILESRLLIGELDDTEELFSV